MIETITESVAKGLDPSKRSKKSFCVAGAALLPRRLAWRDRQSAGSGEGL
jgi:hypothetical protein